jgi:Zn-dependent peptidase ImmA (M78 family)
VVWTTTIPELRAKALLKLIDDRQPVELAELAKKIGLSIRHVPSDGFEGALVRIVNQPIGIVAVRKNMPRPRERFTIAHEIGHFVLPGHEDERRVCSEEEIETPEADAKDVKPEDAYNRRLEQEAHKFASRLLMPSPVIGRIVKRLGFSIQTCELVSRLFQVSLMAAAARCVEEDESQHNGPALVVSKKNMVKYFVKSIKFSEYIEIDRPIPSGSLAKQLSVRGERRKAGHVSAKIWTDTSLPALIWEESILLPKYDTVVTLLHL